MKGKIIIITEEIDIFRIDIHEKFYTSPPEFSDRRMMVQRRPDKFIMVKTVNEVIDLIKDELSKEKGGSEVKKEEQDVKI